MIGQSSSDVGRSEKIASTALGAGALAECCAWACAVTEKTCAISESARTGESNNRVFFCIDNSYQRNRDPVLHRRGASELRILLSISLFELLNNDGTRSAHAGVL